MKKILVSFLAIAALVGCSKADITYDDQLQEIGFTPYSKKSVKSAVTTTDYPNTLNMYVFAQAGAAGATDVTTYNEPYFKNAEFNDKSTNQADGIFSGTAQPYYWPNVKRLIFSGVSASGNVNNGVTPTYAKNATTNAWEITLNGYKPGTGTTKLGDNDLMWFPTTASYSKDEIVGTGKPGHVDVTMKHACSWITINMKGDEITGAENTTWKIKSLSINGLSLSGDVVLGENADWDNLSSASDKPFTVFNGSKELTKAATPFENISNNTIVIPQTPTTLTIVYEFVSQKGGASDGKDIIIEETKTVDLTLADTVTGKDDQGNDIKGGNWLPGVHYTYNITIGTSEILIDPAVLNWAEQTVTGIVM